MIVQICIGSSCHLKGSEELATMMQNAIEENNLEEELSNRVIEKWENFEDSLKSNRKKKYYATQPE